MINVTLNTQKRKSIPDNTLLGFEEDNNSNKIVFNFEDGFIDGIARLYIKKGDKKGNVRLKKEGETYVLPVERSLFIDTGYIDFQLTMYQEDDVVASYDAFSLLIKDKIITDEEIPEELPSYVDEYNAKIFELNEAIENSQVVAEELLTAKENGEFNGEKGDKGDKGDAGSIKFIVVTELPIESIDESAIYMKSLADSEEQNKYEEFIYVDGEWESLGTAQVEVNLEDYVKNTDYASYEKAGIVKIQANRGIGIDSVSNAIKLYSASNEQIDSRASTLSVICPINLVYAVESVVGGHVTLTQAEYDALETKDENTFYYIEEE